MKLERPIWIGVLIGAALVLTMISVLPWPSLAAEPIKIGLITDLTGMAFLLAKDNGDGAKMAVEEINKAGGVLGRPLELIVRDSALKTDLGIAAACNIKGCLGGHLQPGIPVVIVVISFFSWSYIARIVRGYTLSLREKEFVESARALGASNSRILATEILPNQIGRAHV